jgi:acetyl-CoA acyltransferase
MSRVAMGSNSMGQDNFGPLHRARYPDGLVHQGISAELVAAHWDIDRQSLDAFALRSHQLAADAATRGITGRDIVAIGSAYRDEGIRADTSLEKLGQLKPAFVNEKMAERYPEIAWRVTAGNSSQVSDGASAMLIASEKAVERLGLKPRAAISHFAVAGDDPIMMLTGIIPATRKLLARAELSLDDINLFEVNEAFSSVVLAWMRELGVGENKVNVNGGALALGHPLGASGGRLTANLLGALEETGGRYGLQTMCEAGGMANATLIERLG